MYIGTQPYSGIRARHTYTATAGQTSFSGAGAENVTLTYSDELYIDVYQNGVKLSPADYTATSGTTVVLATGATVSDIVEVIKYDAFSVADTVSAKDGGGFGGDVSSSGTFLPTGDTAAGDAAAIGFTSAEGLILTGQGSTSDITVKNDADAIVFTVPTGTDDILFPDEAKIKMGASGDLEIFHDANNSYIKDTGTGSLIVQTNSFELKNAAGNESVLLGTEDGAVTLYHNNSAKLATASGGVTITGDIANASGDMTIDVAGDLIIDVDGEEVLIKDAGTHIGGFKNVGTNFVIKSVPDNSDIIFQGTDGGSGIEAARFDMSAEGALCLGATSQVGAGILGISFNDSAVHGIDIIVEANASGAGFVVFRSAGGGVIGQINRNGTSNAVQYTTSSDYRLKENITYDWDATTRLKQLKPARFNWINDDTNTAIDGFIAHEVQSVVPNAVNGEKDATEIFKDADDKEQTIIKPQGIDKSDLVPLLVKSLQEALTEIDTLKTKVAALEGE